MIHKKKLNKVALYLFSGFFIFFCACSSHKKINRLAEQLECDKAYHFVFDDASNFTKIEYIGEPTIGNSEYPNYKESFRKSIEQLNKSTSAKLVYKEAFGFPSDSIIQVRVRIEKIIWYIKKSSATMSTDLIYDINGKKIKITGDNTVHLAGTKTGNLYKSLKSGNLIFLNINCDN